MDIFIYENFNLEVNKYEILLVKEFAELWDTNRNKGLGDNRGYEKKRAYKEFQYMYLVHDWKSPYSEFSEKEKHDAALSDTGLTEKQCQDEKFKAACKKYVDLQDSRILKLLKSAYKATDELRIFFDTVDLQERDEETNKPIYKSNDIIANIANLGKMIEGLQQLEYTVKKDKEKERGLRGQAEAGMFD